MLGNGQAQIYTCLVLSANANFFQLYSGKNLNKRMSSWQLFCLATRGTEALGMPLFFLGGCEVSWPSETVPDMI